MALAITQPADQNLLVGDPLLIEWKASAGTTDSTVVKSYDSTVFENGTSLVENPITGDIYAGFGNTVYTDAKIFKLEKSTGEWLEYLYVPDRAFVYAMAMSDDGDLYSFVSGGVFAETKIYKNTSLLQTVPPIGRYDEFRDAIVFPNGNVLAGVLACPFADTLTGNKLFLSTNGTSFSEISYSMLDAVRILLLDSTTAIVCTLSTTMLVSDTGTVSNLINHYSDPSLMMFRLSQTEIAITNMAIPSQRWRVTTNGVTWSDYTGLQPNIQVLWGSFSSVGGCYITTRSNAFFKIHDGTYTQHLMPTDVTRSDIVLANTNAVYTIGGYGTGKGDVYVMQLVPFYSASIKKGITEIATETNTTGLFSYSKAEVELSDLDTYEITVTNNGVDISDSVAISVEAIVIVVAPETVSATVGDTIVLTATSNATSFQWCNGDEELIGERGETLTIVATLEDNGSNYYCVGAYGSVIVSSNVVVMTVTSYCQGAIRFLFEMSVRSSWNPQLTVSSIYKSEFGEISEFFVGAKSATYWNDWGGYYDNPTTDQLELFFGAYLVRVSTLELLLSTSFSFFYDGNGTIYTNTFFYTWQYFNTDSFLSSILGFSSSVKNSLNQSDDYYSGIRYPVRMRVPSLGMMSIPDPINGVIPMGAFQVTLDNHDGYFDSIDVQTLFNSPVRLKKSTVDQPELSDFKTIKVGFVDTVMNSFTDFTVKTFEPLRAFTQEVCRPIVAGMFAGQDDSAVDKLLPVVYGVAKRCPVIKIAENSLLYVVGDPDYISEITGCYNSENEPVNFTDYADGVIAADAEISYASVIGKQPCTIGEIIVNEVSEKSSQQFIDAIWDIEEVTIYKQISPEIGFYFSGGTVKSLCESVLKSDSAFFFAKNDGRLTIRRRGYDYETHTLESWKLTKQPDRSYSDSKYWCSSVQIGWDYWHGKKVSNQKFLNNYLETQIYEIYTKKTMLSYDTFLTHQDEAVSLATRLLTAQKKRKEIIRTAGGFDTSLINILDIVSMKFTVNQRTFSAVQHWIVRGVDAAQDTLELEEFEMPSVVSSGTMSYPSVVGESGIMSHLSVAGKSGELTNPFKVS